MQTFTGKEYLKIDIANSFGLDGKIWDERIKWFDDNEADLEKLTHQAKEPAQFMAGTFAWRDTQQGIPTGYMCGLDATASGIQILSVMSGCVQSASMCNLTNTGARQDAYNNTHLLMDKMLTTPFTFNRKGTKNALMTHMYSSTAVPKSVFNEDNGELSCFYQVVDMLFPGANAYNKALANLWNPSTLAHEWKMPDGFDVKIKVMDKVIHNITFMDKNYEVVEEVNMPKDASRSLPANIVHSIDGMIVREMQRRCNHKVKAGLVYVMNNFSKGFGHSTSRAEDLALLVQLSMFESTGFMSAVILNYINEDNAGHLDTDAIEAVLRLYSSLPPKPFELVAIHDCFRFHANNGNDVRHQYVNIMAELADSEITKSIAEQLMGQPVVVPKFSPNLSELIRQSEYALS